MRKGTTHFQLPLWLFYTFGASVLILSYIRIHFGISLTDESFYLALPYRFLLGDTPFVDELNTLQLFSVLTYPLVWLHHRLVGDSHGLMIFMRASFLAFSMGVGSVLYHCLKKDVGQRTAFLIGLLPLCFVPFSIANLSYNTLGIGFLTIGIFVGLYIIAEDSSRLALSFIAGLAHGLSIVAYPTFLFAVLAFSFVFFLSLRKKKLILPYTIAGILVGMTILISVPFEHLQNSLNFTSTPQHGWRGAKLFMVVRDFYYWGPSKPILLSGLVGFLLLQNKLPKLLASLLVFLPLVCWVSTQGTSLGALLMSIYFSMIGPFLVVPLWKDASARRMFLLVWVPSFIAGLAAGFTSGNGTFMAGLGLFPASIASLLLVTTHAKRLSPSASWQQFTPCALFIGMLLIHHVSVVYRDAPMPQLTARVEGGVFDRIYTTKTRKNLLEGLGRDLQEIEASEARIVFFDLFPAGYLLSSIRPATPTVWDCIAFSIYKDPTLCMKHYQKSGLPHNIAVRILSEEVKDPLLEKFVKERQVLQTSNELYQIYSGVKTSGHSS